LNFRQFRNQILLPAVAARLNGRGEPPGAEHAATAAAGPSIAIAPSAGTRASHARTSSSVASVGTSSVLASGAASTGSSFRRRANSISIHSPRSFGQFAIALPDRNASQHVVGPAGEQAKHFGRLPVIGRLAQHVIVDHDSRVGADDDAAGAQAGHGCRLVCGHPHHERARILARQPPLVDRRSLDVELEARCSKQLRPPRRLRGENQAHEVII
jgi:hypothetical protein